MELITGGTGLLGRHLAESLRAAGRDVRLFDFREPENLPSGAEFHRGDIRDPAAVSTALDSVHTVYHLAALMHVGRNDPFLMHSVNIGGLKNLMARAEAAGVRRIVFASTIELYGVRPADPCPEDSPKKPPPGYAFHKFTGERLLRDFSARTGIEVVFPRMPMVLGPGFYHFKLVLHFFETIRRHLPVFVLDGGTRRGRMVAARDVVQGLRLCAETPGISGLAFNICADDAFTHRELLEGVIKRVGSRSRVFSVPSRAVLAGFRLAYPLGLSPVAPEHFLFSLSHCDYSIDRAKQVLGYCPVTDTVSAMAETYEAYMAGRGQELRKKLANDLL